MNRPAEAFVDTAELAAMVVDEPHEGRFDVQRRIFHDPAIFVLEMQRIFERTWVYLAHDSQLPRPNDFYSTQLGLQPVLLTRGADGALHALVNACSHRGAMLTGRQRGNAGSFTCPYHGWTYAPDGRCLAVKDRAGANYPAYFDALDHDLKSLRVDSYRGFIFATLNPDAPSLGEFLGPARVFIDLFVEQSPDGLELVRGRHAYTCDANWKLQLENPDAYHFVPVHLSYMNLGRRRLEASDELLKTIDVTRMEQMPGGMYDLGNGHAVGWTQMPNGDERPLAQQRAAVEARCGADRARWMIDCVRALLVFPNLWLMDQASTTVRVVRPLAVDRTRLDVFCIAPRNEPAAARTLRLRQFEDFLGPAGLATPDDQTVMEHCQRGYAGTAVPWQQGYARGAGGLAWGGDAAAGEIGLHPVASGGITDEVLAHGAYRQWRRLMIGAA